MNLALKSIHDNPDWQLKRTCPFSQKVIIYMDQYNNAPPLPRPHHYRQMLFYTPKTNPDCTVGLVDGERTWYCWLGNQDPNLETLSLRFRLNMKNEDAIREFECLHGLKTIRHLRVMRGEPRWEFLQKGEPQSFEEGKNYEKVKGKKIQNYFTFEDMLRFATNWGCPFGDDDFWDSDQNIFSFGKLPDDENIADWKTVQD